MATHFRVWDSSLPLCIVPQVHHFVEIIVWCAEHYLVESRSIITHKFNQFFLTISKEDVVKTLGLHATNFPKRNTVTLNEEVLVQKFSARTPQEQLTFIQSIQRPKYVLPTLNFPIKADTFPSTIQCILSMYSQVFGQIHNHTISEEFLGFLMYLSKGLNLNTLS